MFSRVLGKSLTKIFNCLFELIGLCYPVLISCVGVLLSPHDGGQSQEPILLLLMNQTEGSRLFKNMNPTLKPEQENQIILEISKQNLRMWQQHWSKTWVFQSSHVTHAKSSHGCGQCHGLHLVLVLLLMNCCILITNIILPVNVDLIFLILLGSVV